MKLLRKQTAHRTFSFYAALMKRKIAEHDGPSKCKVKYALDHTKGLQDTLFVVDAETGSVTDEKVSLQSLGIKRVSGHAGALLLRQMAEEHVERTIAYQKLVKSKVFAIAEQLDEEILHGTDEQLLDGEWFDTITDDMHKHAYYCQSNEFLLENSCDCDKEYRTAWQKLSRHPLSERIFCPSCGVDDDGMNDINDDMCTEIHTNLNNLILKFVREYLSERLKIKTDS